MRMEDDISAGVDERYDWASAVTDRSPMLEISNAMVRLYKDAFGRGPTKARAQFAGPDTLVVTLESSLTVAERNLVAMGEHQRLREARLFFHYALEEQLRRIVEQALGRRTMAFMSGIDTQRDVAIEVFTLEPATAIGDTRRHGARQTRRTLHNHAPVLARVAARASRSRARCARASAAVSGSFIISLVPPVHADNQPV